MRIADRGRFAAALVMAALVAALGGALAVARAAGPAVPAADRAAIDATWTELDAAWVARDAERMTGLFTEDAIFAFLPGERRLEGHAAIRAHFDAQFPSQAPDLRHVSEVLHVQPLASGLALVDADVRVLRTSEDGDAAPDVLRAFHVVAVMGTAAPGRWVLRSVRAFRLPDGDADGTGAKRIADNQ